MKTSISRVCWQPQVAACLHYSLRRSKPSRFVTRCTSRKNETPDQALNRRLRESMQVEQRVTELESHSDFTEKVLKSDDALVVLEVTSDVVCDTGLEEEAEIQWKYERKKQDKKLDEVCSQIKHVFQRTARECKDVQFYAIDCDTENGSILCDELDIDTIPTLQFYRRGQLLWEHKGALHWQQDLGEGRITLSHTFRDERDVIGVLYYANTYAGGADASDHVFQINSEEDFYSFVKEEDNDKTLKIIDVSTESAEPCIKIYPAVLALSKNLKGYVSFARMLVDDPDMVALAKELQIRDVPTFLFYKNGKEVERNASSSRGDLIGQILSVQGMMGLPPPPERGSRKQRSRRAKKV